MLGLSLESSSTAHNMIQDVARQSSSLLSRIRQRATEAGEQISQSISGRSDRLRQRLADRRASLASLRNNTGGVGFKIGGLSVSANTNGTLLGQVRQGVEDRVNSGRSLRTRLANRAGNALQGGITASLNGANSLTDLAQRGVNRGASMTNGLVSRVRGTGNFSRGLVDTGRNVARRVVDSAANLAEAGINMGTNMRNRVLDGVSNLSNLSVGITTSGLNAARDMANRAGGAVSGMVNNAVNSAASSTSIIRNPLSAIGAARDLLGRVSGDAAVSVNGPLGSFSLRYDGDDN